MKNWIVAALVLGASVSFAQTKAKRTTASPAVSGTSTATSTGKKEWYEGRLSVGLSLATSSAMTGIDFRRNKSKQADGEFSSENGTALNFEVKNRLAPRWNWTAGGSLFRERTISSYRGTGNNVIIRSDFKNDPSYQTLMVTGGAQYLMNEHFYIPFGVNIPMFNTTKSGSMKSFSMTPQLGYQFGIGANFVKTVAFELISQTVRYGVDATVDNTTKFEGDAELQGFALQGRYMF